VTLFLSESDVQELLEPADAVDVVEGSFLRMAAGAVEIAPRRRLKLQEGRLADMAASDLELGYAGVKAYGATAHGEAFVVALFATDRPELVALIEADHLGREVEPPERIVGLFLTGHLARLNRGSYWTVHLR